MIALPIIWKCTRTRCARHWLPRGVLALARAIRTTLSVSACATNHCLIRKTCLSDNNDTCINDYQSSTFTHHSIHRVRRLSTVLPRLAVVASQAHGVALGRLGGLSQILRRRSAERGSREPMNSVQNIQHAQTHPPARCLGLWHAFSRYIFTRRRRSLADKQRSSTRRGPAIFRKTEVYLGAA